MNDVEVLHWHEKIPATGIAGVFFDTGKDF